MMDRMKVFGRVLVLRGITASDMPARHAQPEMHPLITHLQTFLTTLRFGLHVLNGGRMRTLAHVPYM
jgi:hypothetical protein